MWGNSFVAGAFVRVNTGDCIWGAMEGNGCNSNGSGCHWAIRTVDQSISGSPESRIDINSDSVSKTAQGGVFESYGAQHCIWLPASHKMTFTGIQVWGPTFDKLTPSFGKVVFDQQWRRNMSISATATTITWHG